MRNTDVKTRLMKLLLGMAMLTLIFSACKKNQMNNGGAYFMKFDVDGKPVEFTNQGSLTASFSASDNKQQYIATFSGFDANSNISVSVLDSSTVVAGSYSGYTTVNSTVGPATVGVEMVYQEPGGSTYGGAGFGNSDLVINISSLTTTTASGTFSGTLYGNGDLPGTGASKIVITNGKFTLFRIN